MNQLEAETLCKELEQLISKGPGANPQALARVEAITRQFSLVAEYGGYIHEKSRHVLFDFQTWFSPRKWQKYGEDKAKYALYQSISKLQGGYQSFGPGGTHPQRTL